MKCRVMQVQRSGYYAWRARSLSQRAQNDRRLLGLIKLSWLESGTVYGYRKITSDLRDLGERVRQEPRVSADARRASVGPAWL